MINRIAILIILVLTLVGCAKDEIALDQSFLTDNSTESSNDLVSNNTIPGSYIVLLDDGTAKSDNNLYDLPYAEHRSIVKQAATKILADNGITTTLSGVYARSFPGFAAELSIAEAQTLAMDPRIKKVEAEQEASLLPGEDIVEAMGGDAASLTLGEAEGTSVQVLPWGVEKVGHQDGTGKTVWVIDTGIDMDHPDLNVDKQRSVSYLNGTAADLSPDDEHGHGTHVAGIIAARDNHLGVVGVAPNATVVALRVLDKYGRGRMSRVLMAVEHVIAYGNPRDVANISLSGGRSIIMDRAIKEAGAQGIQVVMSAGNYAMDTDYFSPPRASGVNVYTISAIDKDNKLAIFSNYGNSVDFAAPGVSIQSTYKDGGYATLSGTSMAAPHMAGMLALGNISIDGFAQNDKDTRPDPIAVLLN